MEQKLIALIGAGGKMGRRILPNLQKFGYHFVGCEKDEAGLAALRELGIDALPTEEAVALADIVVFALPDAALPGLSKRLVPLLKPGAIALTRPLVSAGILPAELPVSYNAVSGYSGGGKAMIAEFEDETAANPTRVPYRIYGLSLSHKHVPEMQMHGGLLTRPIFMPAVGRYRQGMIVEMPLHFATLNGAPSLGDIHDTLAKHYKGERFVEVASLDEAKGLTTLDPEGLNGTNRLKLFVFGSDTSGQARLVALLDNLGKGASGAAVQNLNIALGLKEDAGL